MHTNLLKLAMAHCTRYPRPQSLIATAHSHLHDIICKNRLISEHSKAGNFVAAQRVFDEMPERDIVSWNSIMAACARSGRHGEAVRAFLDLRHCGFRPDHTSFSTALSAGACLGALELGQCFHGLALKMGSSCNVFVGTSLITMYANCGVFDCLERVLDGVGHPNVASWNAVISGLILDHRIADARRVFDWMPVRNVVSWTAMIKGYVTVDKVVTAFELFDLMPTKNSVSWCVMIGGFVLHERFKEAIELFQKLMREGEEVTSAILVKVVNAYSGLKKIEAGKSVHGFAVKSGLVMDQSIEVSLVVIYCECLKIDEARLEFNKMVGKHVCSWNAIIRGYIDAKKVDGARQVFDAMVDRDNISWNSMITGYLKDNRIVDATDLYSKMPEKTLEAATALMSSFIDNGSIDKARDLFYSLPRVDVMACTTLLSGYLKQGLLDDAFDLFNRMRKRTVVTYNAMISGLLHLGKVTEAYKLFDESPMLDATSWNCLIIGVAQVGLIDEALVLYKKMVSGNLSPSESVVASLLSYLSQHSMIAHGQQLHATTVKLGLKKHLLIQNSLISLYCKCGEMIMARNVFDGMANRDVVTWNTIIHGYALNSLGEDAIAMFENMKAASVNPDDITFLGVLSACNHLSLLVEARHFFHAMTGDFGIVPNMMHYACMIDLLCRRGLLEEAERLVKSMPFEPDSVIWTSLLSSCRSNCNDKLAGYAANQLFASNSSWKMPYLHLINIHGLAKRWSIIESLRSQMKSSTSNREIGCSWT